MTEMCEKPQLQQRLDTWARRWMQALLVALGLQLILLLLGGYDLQESLQQLTTVILLGCPCALSLAGVVPLYRLSSLWSQVGIKVRSLVSIETCAAIDTIVFDKTGTLTSLQLAPVSRQALQTWAVEDIALLKTAAQLSRHPCSESLNTLLINTKSPEVVVKQCTEYPGKGIAIDLRSGEILRFGSMSWLQSEGVDLPDNLSGTVALALGVRLIGSLQFTQNKQTNLAPMLTALQQNNIQLILCSGDSKHAVQDFAQDYGKLFSAVYAQQTPEQKRQLVQDLKQQGRTVAMVGDGINDVASSSAADLGVGFLHTTGTGLHQDLQLDSTSHVLRVPELLKQAVLALKLSRLNLLIPIVTTTILLIVNTFTTVPPLLVAFSMFSNIAIICLLTRTIRSFNPES